MKLTCLVFFFLILQAVLGENTPKILSISKEKIKDIGSTVELECKIKNDQKAPVYWIKIPKTINFFSLSSDKPSITPSGRVSLDYDESGTTYTLKIEDIHRSDDGRYQCLMVISQKTRISAEVDLHVRRSPVFLDNISKPSMKKEGQSLELKCHVDAYPQAVISWMRENQIAMSHGTILKNDKLIIPQLEIRDEGVYFCTADNGIGERVRQNMSVKIDFSRKTTFSHPRLR